MITHQYPYKNEIENLDTTKVIHYVAREFHNLGHNVQIFVPFSYYPLIFNIFKKGRDKYKLRDMESFLHDNVIVYRMPLKKLPKKKHNLKTIRKCTNQIARKIKGFKTSPDYILSDFINPGGKIAYLVSSKLDLDYTLALHNADISFLSKNRDDEFTKKVISSAQVLIFRSLIIQKQFSELFPGIYNRKKHFYSPFGIKQEDIIEKENLKFPEKMEKLRIITVSRLLSIKKIDSIIKAIGLLSKYNVELTIVGDGPEKSQLMKLTNQLGLTSKINFTGRLKREKVIELMRKHDVFVMISSPETFGLVYIEAMGNGCITIGSRGEGIDGVIHHGENGLLCSPGDHIELSKIIVKIINMNEHDRRRIILRGYETAKNLTNKKIAKDFVKKLKGN